MIERLQKILGTLNELSEEYPENTSLSTIINSIQSRIEHYNITKCSKKEK